MPVTIVTEDGTGLANANTYVDPAGAFATSYADAWIDAYKTEWTAASANSRAQAVVSATRAMDAQFTWRGTQLRPGAQALGWPRYVACSNIPSNAVPVPVQQATMEMALALLQRNRTSDTSSGSRAVASIGLGNGALEMKFASDPQAGPVSSVIPPNVSALLRDYGNAAGTGMARVERR